MYFLVMAELIINIGYYADLELMKHFSLSTKW